MSRTLNMAIVLMSFSKVSCDFSVLNVSHLHRSYLHIQQKMKPVNLQANTGSHVNFWQKHSKTQANLLYTVFTNDSRNLTLITFEGLSTSTWPDKLTAEVPNIMCQKLHFVACQILFPLTHPPPRNIVLYSPESTLLVMSFSGDASEGTANNVSCRAWMLLSS